MTTVQRARTLLADRVGSVPLSPHPHRRSRTPLLLPFFLSLPPPLVLPFINLLPLSTYVEWGELFAEAFACAAPATPQLPVSVRADAFCTVWLLNYPRLLALATGGQDQHGSYARLLGNLVSIMAQKNVTLNRRLRHLSHRSTREKLLSYLEAQAGGSPDGMFTFQFNRQELADYLCVERSAMSAVLSRLQKEGRITYQRNRFQLRPSVATEGPAQSTPENG